MPRALDPMAQSTSYIRGIHPKVKIIEGLLIKSLSSFRTPRQPPKCEPQAIWPHQYHTVLFPSVLRATSRVDRLGVPFKLKQGHNTRIHRPAVSAASQVLTPISADTNNRVVELAHRRERICKDSISPSFFSDPFLRSGRAPWLRVRWASRWCAAMLLSFSLGFLVGFVVLVAVEGLALLWLIDRLRRKRPAVKGARPQLVGQDLGDERSLTVPLEKKVGDFD
ncbi:hypothetical protein B296_00007442 [Ensete ventricosum]|uniref:Uncharacterized protein n=1 Tax=Ensete ventricosum TaxID=4639 RepID=A0A427AL31_ENSVE|nr:hypothetical protein B296_00007442 [Ensete ventricosum]